MYTKNQSQSKTALIMELEEINTSYVHFYLNGTFWRCYDRSAFLFYKYINPEYILVKRVVKNINRDVIYNGFPNYCIDLYTPAGTLEEDTPTYKRIRLDKTIDLTEFNDWCGSIQLTKNRNLPDTTEQPFQQQPSRVLQFSPLFPKKSDPELDILSKYATEEPQQPSTQNSPITIPSESETMAQILSEISRLGLQERESCKNASKEQLELQYLQRLRLQLQQQESQQPPQQQPQQQQPPQSNFTPSYQNVTVYDISTLNIIADLISSFNIDVSTPLNCMNFIAELKKRLNGLS